MKLKWVTRAPGIKTADGVGNWKYTFMRGDINVGIQVKIEHKYPRFSASKHFRLLASQRAHQWIKRHHKAVIATIVPI